jgi:cytochrome P450
LLKSLKKDDFSKISDSEWEKIFIEEELLGTCDYLSYCINETLRIEPSVRISTPHVMEGSAKIGEFNILNGTPLSINIYGLHHNPK